MSLQDDIGSFWSSRNISVNAICQVLFDISRGDKRVLNTSVKNYKLRKSVWGKAIEKLLPDSSNTERERLFLYRAWSNKRKNIEEVYNQLAGKKCKPREEPNKLDGQDDYQGCVCERCYNPTNESRIQCDHCLKWLHASCGMVSVSDYKEDDPFVCGYCDGSLKVPPMFEDTKSSFVNIQPKKSASLDEAYKTFRDFPREDDKSSLLSNLSPIKTNGHTSDASFNASQSSWSNENLKSGLKTSTPKSDSRKTQPDQDFTPKSRPAGKTNSHGLLRDGKLILRPQKITINDLPTALGQNNDKSNIFFPKTEISRTNSIASHEGSDSSEQNDSTDNDNSDQEESAEREDPVSVRVDRSQKLNRDQDSRNCNNPAGDKTRNDDDDDPDFRNVFKRGNNAPKDDKDKDDKNDTEEKKSETQEPEVPIDVSGMKKKFSLTLSPEEWEQVVRLKKRKSGKKIKHYAFGTDVKNFLNKGFDSKNKICTLAFDKRRLGDPLNLKTMFFCQYAHCSNETCTAMWKFFVQGAPEKGSDVKLVVSMYKGRVLHYTSKPSSRKWTGIYKEEAKALLKDKLPAAARIEACKTIDTEAVKNGKTTSMKSLATFQNIKQKMNEEQDLNKNIVTDLVLLKASLRDLFPDKELPGFIQNIQISPTKVYLFSYEQMNFLHVLQSAGPVSLFLDATGSLFKNLGEPYDTKQILLYSIIVQSPEEKQTPIPVCEMITSDHRHVNIFSWLYNFFNLYENRFNILLPHYGIEKFEIDFSRPLLTSLVRMFFKGSLDEYINLFWDFFTESDNEKEPLNIFPIHICRFHVVKAIRKKLITCYRNRDPGEKHRIVDTIMEWVYKLVRCNDLFSLDRLLKDIGVVTLNKHYTPAVARRLEGWKNPTKRGSTPPWIDFVKQQQPKNSAFWKKTYFGQYVNSIFNHCLELNQEFIDSDASSCPLNGFFCKDFADYVETYVIPYVPLLSHLVYVACGVRSRSDTNNVIERFFGILKGNIFKDQRHLKLSRFARKHADFVKGVLTSALLTYQLRKKTGTEPKMGNPSKPGTKKGPNLDHDDISSDDDDAQSSKSTNIVNHADKKAKHGSPLKQENKEDPKDEVFETSSDDDDLHSSDSAKSRMSIDSGPSRKASPSDNDDETWNVLATPASSFKGKNYETKNPEKQTEKFKKTSSRDFVITPALEFITCVPVVRWGGTYQDEDLSLPLINTCSIDTTLQVLVALNVIYPEMQDFWKEKAEFGNQIRAIGDAVNLAQAEAFDEAKTVWIRDVMNKDPSGLENPGDMINSEFESGFQFVGDMFSVHMYNQCLKDGCTLSRNTNVPSKKNSRRWKAENSTLSNIRKPTPHQFENTINFAGFYHTPCTCGAERAVQYETAFGNPPFIMYSLLHDEKFGFNEMNVPKEQKIAGVCYKVFAYTCVVGNKSANEEKHLGIAHFIVKFLIGNKKIVYDGRCSRPVVEQKCPGDMVTSLWLVPLK